jgi:hypothetical protein
VLLLVPLLLLLLVVVVVGRDNWSKRYSRRTPWQWHQRQ